MNQTAGAPPLSLRFLERQDGGLDSAGIGALVGAHVSHSKNGRSLALTGVCERVLNALKVTRVDGFFNLYKNIADAEKSA